jgi:voltage-gated potassium channel Kch
MVSLLLVFKRFWKVIRQGWDDREFRGLAIVLGGWLALGTIVYTVNEGWGVIESLYFCVMTLTTIGYGDYTPSDSVMQVYTIIYAVLGIGFFVAFTARIVQVGFESRRRDDAAVTGTEPSGG